MTLIAGSGTQRITRNELATLPMPERTASFQPIGHNVFIDTVEEALSFRHISIVSSEFAVSDDGMKMFSTLQVNSDYEGVSFVIGCRNSNDKSFRLGMVCGYRVMVCSNLSFHGDFTQLSAKHTKMFNLEEAVALGVDRTQRQWGPIREAIDRKRTLEISDDNARVALYKLFTEAKMPVSLFRTVHNEYFGQQPIEEFAPRTVWSLENAVTSGIKKLKPIAQYDATARLGKFVSNELLALPA